MNVPLLVVVLIAIGCGSKGEPAAGSAESARPTVTDPLGFCERARMLIERRRKCFPEDTALKMALDGLDELVAEAPADREPRRRVAAKCAVMVDGIMRAKQPASCPLDVTDEERAELIAFLASWYGERTAPPTTGNADVDSALVKLGSQRDAACTCKDMACARQAEAGLDIALPSDAPTAANEAKAKMLDEAARCKQKISSGS
jgi:hypothetical protein